MIKQLVDYFQKNKTLVDPIVMTKILEEVKIHLPLIINISHQKGGVGKSTMAWNLADAFRSLGLKVKLIDIDLQNTCIDLNDLREEPFTDIVQIEDEQHLISLINNVEEEPDEIYIIDSGGFDSSLTRLAIMGSDINLTPVADRVTEVLAVVKKYSKILYEIEASSNENVKSYVFLNRIHPFATRFEHIEEMVDDSQHMSMFDAIVRDRAIYDKSLVDGRTVFEASDLKGHESAVSEMLAVCYELMKIHTKKEQ
jgi:chromosome partitioning protein